MKASLANCRRILVAVKDPRSRSKPAVLKAAQLARALGAEIELYHAIDTSLYVDQIGLAGEDPNEFQRNVCEQYRGELESIAERLRRDALRVSVFVEWDYPAFEAVVRRASETQAGLIVVECHRHHHRIPWLLEFTDWELLRIAPMPVLLVKSPRAYRRPVVLAAIDPSHAHEKTAHLDREILKSAVTISGALQGMLHAMHTCPMPPLSGMVDFGPGMGAAPVDQELMQERLQGARRNFERILAPLKVPAARRYFMTSTAVAAIPIVARSSRAAMVVMGTVSRSRLKRLFIGNTAERALDALTCDVLIAKPSVFRRRVQRSHRGARLTAMPYAL
jgi:universal stress protein E